MAKRPGTVMRLATPLKAWAQRFVFLALAAAAFALMLLGKADIAIIDRARTAVQDAVAPLLDGLSKPIDSVNGIIDYASELANLQAMNQALREENERLLQWQSTARELMAENERLRQLLNFTPDPAARFISARVLLLTDLNSRVPVLVGSNRDRAVLVGDNSAQPDIVYLEDDATVLLGDYVVTSGHGGVFPPGLPVGVVSRVADGIIEVNPFVDWEHLEVVRLVDYALPGLLDQPAGGDASPGAQP